MNPEEEKAVARILRRFDAVWARVKNEGSAGLAAARGVKLMPRRGRVRPCPPGCRRRR